MKSLKVKGVRELTSYRKRVLGQYGLGRIDTETFNSLLERVDALIQFTQEIEEEDDDEEYEEDSV